MASRRLRRQIGLVGLFVALTTVLSLPAGYAIVRYMSEASALTFKARLSGDRVAGYIYMHPQMWQYQRDRLMVLIAFGKADSVYQRVIDASGAVVSTEGEPVPAPSLTRGSPIMVSDSVVGSVQVTTSAWSLLVSTAIVGSFSSLLGLLAYYAFRTLPLRMLDRTLDELEDQNHRFDAALNNMTQGLCMFDAQNKVSVANQRLIDMFGMSDLAIVRQATTDDLMRVLVAQGAVDYRLGATLFRGPDKTAVERTSNELCEMLDGRTIAVFREAIAGGGWVATYEDITELKRAQVALLESEERLERAQEIAGIGSWELDVTTGRYIWSKELYRIRGLVPGTFEPDIDNVAQFVDPDDLKLVRRWLADLQAGVDHGTIETKIIRPDGDVRLLRVEGRAVLDTDGVIRRLAGTMQDVTERRLIEQQLVQAQKMEAIGNLTGGMAHDFNNVLGVIIGNLDLLGRLIKDNAAAELCDEARDGALRCADLIRRLLAFARRQPLRPECTDVNALVEGIGKLLSRTLGEHIDLTVRLDPTVWAVVVDPAQLESALTNLATNARDAMDRGGRLLITTGNTRLDAAYAEHHPGIIPGEYVLIEVSDTGTGIDPAVVGRIFEPFFTTKEPGKGTGLGLSMVFGFVKQSGGHLAVYSEPGHGSTFRIYLPRGEGSAGGGSATVLDERPVVGGHETVLVVEDNPRLRQAALQQLAALGYVIHEADSAEAALDILVSADHLDLLFTDVIMPGHMDGIDLARRATELRPGLRVLLTSGFPDLRAAERRVSNPGDRLLNKPYRHDDLARAVRQVLDSGFSHGDPVLMTME